MAHEMTKLRMVFSNLNWKNRLCWTSWYVLENFGVGWAEKLWTKTFGKNCQKLKQWFVVLGVEFNETIVDCFKKIKC